MSSCFSDQIACHLVLLQISIILAQYLRLKFNILLRVQVSSMLDKFGSLLGAWILCPNAIFFCFFSFLHNFIPSTHDGNWHHYFLGFLLHNIQDNSIFFFLFFPTIGRSEFDLFHSSVDVLLLILYPSTFKVLGGFSSWSRCIRL